MNPTGPDTATEANRLYWDTEESVGEIAERLDISRRALYDVIEPRATGEPCPTCGGPLAFENRSARTAGDATCAICAETGATPEEEVGETEPRITAPLDDIEERTFLVGGAMLAGAAVGALLTLALVPRR